MMFKDIILNQEHPLNHQKPCFGYLKTRFFGGENLGSFSIGLAGAPGKSIGLNPLGKQRSFRETPYKQWFLEA